MSASARDVLILALKRTWDAGRGPYGEDADSILAALSAAGLVIVPREPTMKMKMFAAENSKITDVYEADSVWRSMLSAAEGKK